MIQQLELKHLAPYLPYGLKVYNDMWPNMIHILTTENLTRFLSYKSHATKPLLRPLSDFNTRWMNEEQFSKWLAIKNDPAFGFDGIEFNEYGNLLIRFSDHQSVVSINLEVLPVLNFLLKHHFDVFQLIPAGLAISINDIK
jgi:hypothetical protein